MTFYDNQSNGQCTRNAEDLLRRYLMFRSQRENAAQLAEDARNMADTGLECYFRAWCEITEVHEERTLSLLSQALENLDEQSFLKFERLSCFIKDWQDLT